MRLLRAGLSAAAFALLLASTIGALAGFPERPIKFILGFGTGGPTDIVARTVAEKLTGDLSVKNVIVENKGRRIG